MRFLPAGARALLVEVDDAVVAGALLAEIGRRRADGWAPSLVDVVPGARTVLLDGLDDPVGAAADIRSWPIGSEAPAGGPEVEIRCVYDGADLAAVAERWDVAVGEVARIHSAMAHVVAFCGFAPGFAYIEGLGAPGAVPRRSSPRSRVPAGSVAVAGTHTGIYPRASPGGWNLIGRTDAVLWDPGRAPPALLQPGCRVRFVEVAPDVMPPTGATALDGDRKRALRRPSHRSARVVRAGALTTLQDDGRPGLAHLAVPRSGALDGGAHRLANRLVGNAETEVVLETTMDGTALAFDTDATVAVTGARAAVRIDGREVGWGLPALVLAGQQLEVGRAQGGVRSYVAVAGGWRVAPVLASASTDLLSGLGPSPVSAGDHLGIGSPYAPAPAVDLAPYAVAPAHVELALGLGPRHDWLSDEGLETLATGRWTVTADSNRIAVRLAGPPVARSRRGELPSEGVVLGSVQLLPDGQLVVFLADHPTTGGYPVVAVVEAHRIDRCAQVRPGDTLGWRLHAAVETRGTAPQSWPP